MEESKNLFLSFLNSDSINNNDYIDINQNDYCSISNKPLESNYITLDCSHSFNYVPLYKEITYQKTYRHMDNRYLAYDQIRCPLCRKITNKLIPYFSYYDIPSIRQVSLPLSKCIKLYECSHVNKKTNIQCCKSACLTKKGIFCNKHIKDTYENEELLENIDITIYNLYKKLTIPKLKQLLKDNKCKVSGNKNDLINRIILNKQKKHNWIE